MENMKTPSDPRSHPPTNKRMEVIEEIGDTNATRLLAKGIFDAIQEDNMFGIPRRTIYEVCAYAATSIVNAFTGKYSTSRLVVPFTYEENTYTMDILCFGVSVTIRTMDEYTGWIKDALTERVKHCDPNSSFTINTTTHKVIKNT